MITGLNNGYDADAVTRRLQIVRYLISGDNQALFARKLGVSRTRWNNYEHGYPITIKMAYAVTGIVPGLTVGWLIAGDEGDLKVDLHKRLREAEQALFPQRQKGGSSSRSGSSRSSAKA